MVLLSAFCVVDPPLSCPQRLNLLADCVQGLDRTGSDDVPSPVVDWILDAEAQVVEPVTLANVNTPSEWKEFEEG